MIQCIGIECLQFFRRFLAVQQSGESLLLVILFELMKQILILVLRFCGLALFSDFFIHFLKQAADFLYTERFYQIFGYTAGYSALCIFKFLIRADQNNFNLGKITCYQCDEFHTVHDGHTDIRD